MNIDRRSTSRSGAKVMVALAYCGCFACGGPQISAPQAAPATEQKADDRDAQVTDQSADAQAKGSISGSDQDQAGQALGTTSAGTAPPTAIGCSIARAFNYHEEWASQLMLPIPTAAYATRMVDSGLAVTAPGRVLLADSTTVDLRGTYEKFVSAAPQMMQIGSYHPHQASFNITAYVDLHADAPTCPLYVAHSELDGGDKVSDSGGCLDGSTMIRMADGTERHLAALKVGDRVAGPGANHTVVSVYRHSIYDTEDMIEITVAGRRLLATPTHPIMTSSGIKAAQDLDVRDRILTSDGASHLPGLRRLHGNRGTVYNLLVDGNGENAHLIVAGGMVAGDLALESAAIVARARVPKPTIPTGLVARARTR